MLTVGSNITFYSCWRCNLQLSLQEFNYDVFHYKQFVINSNYKQTFIAILPLSNPPISYSEPHAAHLHCSFATYVDTEEDTQFIPLENQSIILTVYNRGHKIHPSRVPMSTFIAKLPLSNPSHILIYTEPHAAHFHCSF